MELRRALWYTTFTIQAADAMELADEKVFGLATGEKFSSKSSQAQAKEVAIAPRTAKKQQKRSIVRPSQTNSVLGRLKKAAAQSPPAVKK